MNKKKSYILSRLLRSMISILVIMTVVFVMVYSLVPRDNIFFNDGTYSKLSGKPDEKRDYVLRTWQKLGYLDYQTINVYCEGVYGSGNEGVSACILPDSKESADFKAEYESKGYTVEALSISKQLYAYKDIPMVKRLFNWFKDLIFIDHPWSIKDPNNPELERYIRPSTTETGGLALKCSGCTYKYLLYTDTNFPYIHQNIISLNMGTSYPTFQGLDVLSVIFDYQGTEVKRDVTYETGLKGESSLIFGTLKYKYTLDRLDTQKFVDHYADGKSLKSQQSMIGISFLMGIFSLVLAYGIGLPVGVLMAKNKDGIIDKLGMVYIIFIIAVPSLAYIYVFRYLGTIIFGLPTVFTTYGASDVRSWILPIVSLALPSISGLMLWTRRYVVDQMNSDYVKFAKAKGLNQSEIFRTHIFKNAIIPIAQGIPSSLAGCIAGAIITESIYSVGGMGKMLPDATKQYNNVMVVALTFLFSSISVLSVFMGDLVLTWVDPRIQLAEKEGRS